MNTLAPRPFAFSSGRPLGQIFQTVSTLDLPPKQQYARWGEEVIRTYRVSPAHEGQQVGIAGHPRPKARPRRSAVPVRVVVFMVVSCC